MSPQYSQRRRRTGHPSTIYSVLHFGLLCVTLFLASVRSDASEPVALGQGGSRLQPGESIPAAQLEPFVDDVLQRALTTEHVAGASVAIVQRGQTVLLKGYGRSAVNPDRPVDPSQTLFRLGSISKVFVWVSLMQEVELGRIDLQAPINSYLPEELQIPDDGFAKPIRVVDLMSHAPGFEEMTLRGMFVSDPAKVISLSEHLAGHRPRRVREPGQFSTYSNYGAMLAGAIVAHVNGVDFETLVERKILGPLGMQRTTFREPYQARADLPAPLSSSLAGDVSDGFGWTGTDYSARAFEYISAMAPAGAGSSTAADMSHFMRALLADGSFEGREIFGATAARAFRTPIMKTPAGINGWAHGLAIGAVPGGFKSYGHGGATLSFRSSMVLVPELDLGIFVVANTATGGGVVERLSSLVISQFYGSSKEGSPREFSGEPYEGRYLTTRRGYYGLDKFVGLLGGFSTIEATKQQLVITGASGPVSWLADDEIGGFRSVAGDKRLAFEFGPDGRAVRYLPASGVSAMERASPLMNPLLLAILSGGVVLVAIAGWVNAVLRSRRSDAGLWRHRDTSLFLGVSALWLLGILCVGVYLARAGSPQTLYDWPGVALVAGSTTGVLAALGSVGLALLFPVTWRKSDASSWAKVGHALAIAVFIALAADAAAWGLLEPWR